MYIGKNPAGDGITLPSGYGGTAMRKEPISVPPPAGTPTPLYRPGEAESHPDGEPPTFPKPTFDPIPPVAEEPQPESEPDAVGQKTDGSIKDLLHGLSFRNLFPFLPAGGKDRRFGAEEYLLLSLAAYLFFSKDGDRITAAMFLCLLLF